VREHSIDAIRDLFEIEPAKRALRLSPLRRGDAEELRDLERRIELAARLYRHARALARDVADSSLQSTALATATRHLADAADRALQGEDASEPLARAEAVLAAETEPVISMQLRQLLADLRARLR
jgi:hypothetical protein